MSSQNEYIIIKINTLTSQLVMVAWFSGLVYALWFSSVGLPPGVKGIGFIYGAILVVVGIFIDGVIGAGTALILAGISKVLSGSTTGQPAIIMLGLIIAPVLCFMAASGSVYKLAAWDPFGFVKYSGLPQEVHCVRPKLTFTLGYNDNLDVGEQQKLCSCLGNKLTADDLAIIEQEADLVPELDPKVIERVMTSFAGAMHQCGVKF